MNRDLFEYEMKKAGYRTSESRAKAMGIKVSAYYRRVSGESECTNAEIGKVAEIVGKDAAWRIFFGEKVS